MSKQWMYEAAFVCSIGLVGCGGQAGSGASTQGTLVPNYVAPASIDNLPQVPHPEYAHWSQFPVGMGVVRKKEVSNEFGKLQVTSTFRLIEKTAAKVVVESQVTVERPEESVVKNPPQNFEFPATFRLPQGMRVEQFSLPSLKAKHVGEEVRSACGREYTTQLFTWDEMSEAGPMAVKLWRSNDIPGQMLRQEINGRTQVSVEEVVEVVQPVGNAPGAE
jgi:hypothetical protein